MKRSPGWLPKPKKTQKEREKRREKNVKRPDLRKNVNEKRFARQLRRPSPSTEKVAAKTDAPDSRKRKPNGNPSAVEAVISEPDFGPLAPKDEAQVQNDRFVRREVPGQEPETAYGEANAPGRKAQRIDV